MKREVRIQITGVQKNDENEEIVETAAFGDFAVLGEKLCVKYEELSEEGDITKTLIKISDESVEVMKRGYVESKLVFAEGKVTETDYNTPYGIFAMSVDTARAAYELTEEGVSVDIEYTLFLNGEPVSINRLNMKAVFC